MIKRNYKQEYSLKRTKYKPISVNLTHELYNDLLDYHIPISRLIVELLEWAKDRRDILTQIRGDYYEKLREKTRPTETQIEKLKSETEGIRTGDISNNNIE